MSKTVLTLTTRPTQDAPDADGVDHLVDRARTLRREARITGVVDGPALPRILAWYGQDIIVRWTTRAHYIRTRADGKWVLAAPVSANPWTSIRNLVWCIAWMELAMLLAGPDGSEPWEEELAEAFASGDVGAVEHLVGYRNACAAPFFDALMDGAPEEAAAAEVTKQEAA